MIIDCHGHVSAPAELYAYKAGLLSHRGAHGRGAVRVSDEELIAALHKPQIAKCGHLDVLDQHGTDMQLISPRPYQMMHSQDCAFAIQCFTEETNNIIHRHTQLFPDRFVGIGGLPQVAGEPIERVFGELERCIRELGFKGVLLNPDPYENTNPDVPGLDDRYWYPLYEKLCELDVPAHIHATGSRASRVPYSLHFINEETIAVFNLVKSDVLFDFPDLKIVVSHGGGAIPYQLGRFESGTIGPRHRQRFSDGLRKLYFDTVLYTEGALRLLIETVGVDQCLFGSECPGVGSAIVPGTEHSFDHTAPIIQSFDWLSEEDKTKILSGNSIRVFNLDIAEKA